MKIIQDGNPDKLKEIVRFTCKKCDCIFEAEKVNTKLVVNTTKHIIYANVRFVIIRVPAINRFKIPVQATIQTIGKCRLVLEAFTYCMLFRIEHYILCIR